MGRMLEALKQRETQPLAPSSASVPALPEIPAPVVTEETEVPFIEWGPRKSMEASPSVMASPGPQQLGLRPKDETAVALVAPPHSVLFRAVPSIKLTTQFAPELIAFHDPSCAISMQYRELLTALLAGRCEHKPNAFYFTAAQGGSGTTMVLLNAAITAARLGRRRVAVVDANVSKPTMAAALGLAEKPGLREVLAGVASLDEALQETAQQELTALAAGLTQPTGGVRFMAATMRSLLRQLRQRFDLIFVDGPAWDGVPETTSLAAICDAVYFVLSPKEAEAPEVDELFRRIPEQGAKLGGCIISG